MTTAAGTAPASSRKDAPAYEGGVALALGWAQLTIGGQNFQQEVDPAATSARFELDLAAGLDRLYASFYDHAERTIAPYYVYVRRLSAYRAFTPVPSTMRRFSGLL